MERNRPSAPFYKTFFILLLISFACILTLLVPADMMCRSNIDDWAPIYPNSTELSVEYNLVRLRALGTSTVILHSLDDEETVRQFYRDNNLRLLRKQASRGLASTFYSIEPDPDGEGTIILLYSECGT